jgi:hypothetical protein
MIAWIACLRGWRQSDRSDQVLTSFFFFSSSASVPKHSSFAQFVPEHAMARWLTWHHWPGFTITSIWTPLQQSSEGHRASACPFHGPWLIFLVFSPRLLHYNPLPIFLAFCFSISANSTYFLLKLFVVVGGRRR